MAVIADIARTGDTADRTVAFLRAAGTEVKSIFVVWDRGRGALDRLASLGPDIHVLIEDDIMPRVMP